MTILKRVPLFVACHVRFLISDEDDENNTSWLQKETQLWFSMLFCFLRPKHHRPKLKQTSLEQITKFWWTRILIRQCHCTQSDSLSGLGSCGRRTQEGLLALPHAHCPFHEDSLSPFLCKCSSPFDGNLGSHSLSISLLSGRDRGGNGRNEESQRRLPICAPDAGEWLWGTKEVEGSGLMDW